MNNLASARVNIVCFSCSRLRLIPVRACESQIQLGRKSLPEKKQEAVRDGQASLFFMPLVSDAKLCIIGRDKMSVGFRIGCLPVS